MSGAKIAGWILSVLIVFFLLFSAAGKLFIDFEGKDEMFAKLGFTLDLMKKIGVLEVILALVYLVPIRQVAFIGAILLTGYLGGAVCTHVRVADQFFFPIIIGVLVWVALGLRDGRVFQIAFGSKPNDTP
jgi:hypothetical protein